jgi:hypothetical protein
MRDRLTQLAATTGVALGLATWLLAAQATNLSVVRATEASRANYLAHARIWQDPGAISAAEAFAGPAVSLPDTTDAGAADPGLACTFVQPGREIGGNSPKFLCRTTSGRDLRVKYWDPEIRHGNREVFATVAASRLMWMLGFNSVQAVSLNVRCERCPENPHDGTGQARTRRYLGMVQAPWPTPVIVSTVDINQGWAWKELDMAIQSLLPGPERSQQRAYYDGLSLLGVFIQHGDRKSEQQRLYCATDADKAAGESIATKLGVTLTERPGAVACAVPAVSIVDVGSTFGGAGRTSSNATAAMNLEEWQRKPVFVETNGEQCRGELTVSFKAGGGEGHPLVSEEGRVFLLQQLHRLSAEHVRAVFRAARVAELSTRDPLPSVDRRDAVDAWVVAFQDKVHQIERRICQPAR